MRRSTLIGLVLAVALLFAAGCGGRTGTSSTTATTAAPGAATTTTPGSTKATNASAAPDCSKQALLAFLRTAIEFENSSVPIEDVDVKGCQGGYAHVFTLPKPKPPAQYEQEQLFLHWEDGRWVIVDSGTGIACSDPDASRGLVAACRALGERTTAPACDIVRGWNTKPETSDITTHPGVLIVNVRKGRHSCYDRLVVDILGPSPVGYDLRYVKTVTADGSGNAVPVAGNAALQLVIRAPDFGCAQTGKDFGRKPWRFGQVLHAPDWPSLVEVKYAGCFEGHTTFGIGVRTKQPFRLFVLPTPDSRRIVVDIAHH